MIYVSIDIETTGLDRENDQILEFGAIIEDTSKQLSFEEIPKYKAIINCTRISGTAYALKMNQRIIDILAKRPPIFSKANEDYKIEHNIIDSSDLGEEFWNFLRINNLSGIKYPTKILAAGKNFDSFDKQFLVRLPKFSEYIIFNHRTINPAELFIDFINDNEPPSLDMCLERAGFKDEKVTHNALLDAWDVIRVLRTKYQNDIVQKELEGQSSDIK